MNNGGRGGVELTELIFDLLQLRGKVTSTPPSLWKGPQTAHDSQLMRDEQLQTSKLFHVEVKIRLLPAALSHFDNHRGFRYFDIIVLTVFGIRLLAVCF